MPYWKVTYFGRSGSINSETINAETSDQAKAKCGQPSHIIHQVKLDHLGSFKALFKGRQFPLIEQVLFLTTISSKLNSGFTIGKAIKESVPYARLKVTEAQLEVCETPKDYFELLRFDSTAILIADAGDKVGKLPDALHRASKELTERIAVTKEFSKSMRQGLMYSFLGLLLIVAIPLFAGGSINDFLKVQKIPLQINGMTDILLFLHKIYTQYFILMLAAGAGLYYFRDRIWTSVRTLPGLRFINERMKIRRGMDFVSSYHVLQGSGYNNPQTFKFMILSSKGLTHRLYVEASERLIEGRPLATVFDNPEWPELIQQNLQGFEKHTPKGRDVVLKNLGDALKAYYFNYSEKISNTASFIGFMMMLLSIAMLAIGFYMPIINLNAALKHM